ncbi:protein three rows [Lucilia cuprina]|uniref:protein three rows n=1 Tax=Lucilia cuprina TaxID=7375 RepID=UPI001F0571EF|nr:protein three rows [Lucilia cuprina]
MENDFESELKGTPAEATAAKQKIEKYFKRYGDSGHLEARKHQLMFASKIMCTIAKCENKHMDLYCNIIIETFADHLCPEASVKYWTLYVNCIRYFHYLLADKKDFEKASLIYRHISAYDNKLQSNENSLTYIHINCYQLFLQNSLRVQNQDLAVSEATKILENLTKLFNDVLETNKKHNFQYPDLLKKVIQWLFLQNRIGAFYQFIKYLPQNKVKEMFCALFSLYGRQTFDKTFDENESQEQAKFIIETIYSLLQLDIMDKMQLQLAVQLVGQCRTESRLQSYKPIADSFLLLYDYLKLLCSQKSIADFQQIYSIRCERFKELFDKYSKNVMHQPWFGDFLVLLFYLHSQLQNITIFAAFWKQMSKPHCYTSIFKFFMELMKLAPCISAETKLFTINCCSSTRKHVILSFAQIALVAFVFYCQNVSEDDEKQEELENRDSNFDSEPISMNDAIIDWESILDDLASLALCLQLSGYMEHCSRIWLLHYKCSRLIQDAFSALRGLTFFCEYSEHYGKNDNNKAFELEDEIQYHFPTIMQGLENLTNLQRQTYQNYILLAVLQIAYYYARTSRLTFAQMLIQYVEEKHAELVERLGRYDIILATMDVIKFRLMWKHFDAAKSTADEKSVRTSAENLLLHRCLLHEVQETLDRLYEFSYISSCDGLLYSIMIIGLVQELAECTVNRLCDNFINALFIATTKCTLLMGLALRFVQVMGMWMWVNLQMEYVDKAQTKLKIIEYVMGMKSLNEIMEKSTKKTISDIQSSTLLPTQCVELFTQNQYNPGMEAIRRLAQVHLSPIKTDKLQLSPSHRNTDLKRYFKCNVDAKLMPQNEQIEWTLFMVGCLNARLYFLVEDYDQLETFYERGSKWLQMRNNSFNKKYYKNIQLMAMQHYANFLRARKKYDKAVQCLQYGMELCENMKFYVDAVYYVNFQLQLLATQKQMGDCSNVKVQLPTFSKIRRALQFNISPENVQLKEQAKKDLKEKLLQNVMASGKKTTAIMRPLPSIISGSGCSSSKKPKTQTGASISSSSSSSSTSSLDSKTTKPKFEICEDSIEIVETIAPVINSEEAVKTIKRTKSPEEPELLHKTPKVTRTTAKATKTTTASKREAKIKRPELVPPQYHIDIDLTDTPKTSPQKISTSTSSLENLDAKENLNTNDLIAQMENLEIKSTKRTKASRENEIQTKTTRSRGRKPNLVKETVAPVVIVLEDSPCTLKPAPKNGTKEKTKSRNQATSRDKSSSNEDAVDAIAAAESRPRRQRRLVLDKTEKPAESIECTTTASVTRRRQKKIV